MAAGTDLLPPLTMKYPKHAKNYLGAMISIMGLPPHDFVVKKMDIVEKVQRDPSWTREPIEHYFDRESGKLAEWRVEEHGIDHQLYAGDFKHPNLVPERQSLRKLATFLHDDADNAITDTDKEQFLDFVSSILKWDPKERPSARQLLDHPWLKGLDFAERIDESREGGEAKGDW